MTAERRALPTGTTAARPDSETDSRTFVQRLARREQVRFATFLAAFAPIIAVVSVFNMVVGASFHDDVSSMAGILVLAYAGVLALAWLFARRGEVTRAARMATGGLLATNGVLMFVGPEHGPIFLLLPLIAVAIALPYVGRRELAVLFAIAWLECVALTALGGLGGQLGSAPVWFAQSRRLVGPGLTCGLILALLWLFKVRSAETLAAIRNREEAAQAARTRYRGLFDGNPVGLFRASETGVILDANPALLATLDLPEVASLAGTRAAWLPDDLLTEALLRDVRGRDIEATRTDGTGVWLRVSLRAERTAPGPVFEGSAEDVTEQRRIEERLLQAVKLETVGRLAGGVAHDFNNLLTAIRGFASLLDMDLETDDPRRDSVREITRATDRASALTAQLLAVGRRQHLQPEPVDLNALLRELFPSLQQLVGDGIELRLQTRDALAPIVADAAQIERVVMNLAMNGRDAMPDGGTLTISTARIPRRADGADDELAADRSADSVVLTVADTGIGMDAETKSRAFEPFFTTKPPGKGTGLGLATVHGIVVQSGGHLTLDTEPGSGTIFRIFLPATRDGVVDVSPKASAMAAPPAATVHAAASSRPPVPAAAAAFAREPEPLMPMLAPTPAATILLVEDEVQVLRLTARVLERNGYRVLTCERAEAALVLDDAVLREVDLLVTDVVLPGLDGPGMARRLLARRPSLRHLFVSGYSESAVLDPGSLQGPFLPKPYTPEELLERVASLLADPEAAAA